MDVLEALQRFLPYYSSVHRGTGFKSRLSTAAYDEAHAAIARFVGADLRTATVIFGKNTTEAINKLAFQYPLAPHQVILSTVMEHHSNDLPWRRRAPVIRATVTPDGRLDEDDVDRLLSVYGERVALLTVSGASNVTGFIQPVHRLARKAHAVGARILVDAAQLAPHRRIDVKPVNDPEHLDYVVLSAHKMYAPFGTGALVGRRDTFLRGAPEHQGGGTVDVVTPTEVYWAGLPDREEAGSPNVIGAVAMAVAAQTLMDAGMDDVARHEASLTAYALGGCSRYPVWFSTARAIRHHWPIASVSSPSTSDRYLTRWLPPSSATRRGSACGAGVSARNPTSRTCWGARQDARTAGGPRTSRRSAPKGRVWSGSVSGSTTRETTSTR